jgi:hypothetical protein
MRMFLKREIAYDANCIVFRRLGAGAARRPKRLNR